MKPKGNFSIGAQEISSGAKSLYPIENEIKGSTPRLIWPSEWSGNNSGALSKRNEENLNSV